MESRLLQEQQKTPYCIHIIFFLDVSKTSNVQFYNAMASIINFKIIQFDNGMLNVNII